MSGLTDRRIGSAQVTTPAITAWSVRHTAAALAVALLVVFSPPGRAALETAPWVFASVALVLLDAASRMPGRLRGVATGVAAVLDPVALTVVPLLWLTGRRRSAVVSAAVAAAGIAATLPVHGLEGSSWRPLLTDRYLPGDSPDASLRGMLLRIAADRTHGVIGADTETMTLAWVLLGTAVALMALWRAASLHADGQPLLAIAVAVCAGLVVLPVAWTYELLWLLLAAVGRVGARPEDRPVWPALILVAAAVERDVIDPRLGTSLSIVFGNAPTLVALAAAGVVPFRSHADPYWRVRRATAAALPSGRWALLPGKARPVTRPNLLLELMLIRAGYWAYQNIRGDLRVSIPRQREQAIENARNVIEVERFLHIDIEASVNRFSLRSTRFFELMLGYYRELHYVVPIVVLGWLYVRHPTRYRAARTVLAVTTGLALLGYWLYPLCPPRLFPGSGMVASLPGGPRSHVFAVHLINPYAAMPSLHVGWALWCAVAVVCVTRSRLVKALAVLYPCATCFVVVGTANHWVLDGVGAALALGVAVVVQRVLTGRRLRDDVPAFLARLGTAPPAARRAGAYEPGARVPATRGPGARVPATQGRGVPESRSKEGNRPVRKPEESNM